MEKIYKNKEVALRAAKSYQKKNGGVIYDDVISELCDEHGKLIGHFGSIVVGTGIGTEPFGNYWEDFYYNL